MINVSNAFKENIKKKVRKIDGFAELLIDGGYFVKGQTSSFPVWVISDDSAEEVTQDYFQSVIDDDPTMYKYASLEPNRLLLDGTFILPSENYFNKSCGYISHDYGQGSLSIYANYENMMSVAEKKKKFTIYFDEGYATNFTVELVANYAGLETVTHTYTFTNNTKDIVLVDGSDIPDTIDVPGSSVPYPFICCTRININITSWNRPDRRVRIKQVNIGETMLFDKNDIIEMNIDEQTSFDNTETPNNECNIMLNNYDRTFNLLDPNNILNRLNKECAIHMFLGVSLNNGASEYVNMGAYHFSSYQENQDKTITLYGSGVKDIYEERINKLLFMNDSETTVSNLLMQIPVMYDLQYDGVIDTKRTNTANLREQLQAIAIFSCSYIKELRDYNSRVYNMLSIQKMDKNPVDEITLEEQIKEPQITKYNKLATIKINTTQVGTLDYTLKTLAEEQLTINNGVAVVQINSSNPINRGFNIYLIDELGTETQISTGWSCLYSYFTPQIQVFNLTNTNYTGIKIVGQEYSSTRIESTLKNGDIESGSSLEYNNEYLYKKYHKDRIAKYLFKNERDYRFRIEYNGDPSLEVGDAITFETVDGNMIGNIEKINLKYNGGLSSTIEGVCSNV